VTTTPSTLAGPDRGGPAPAPPAAADARHLERLRALCSGARTAAPSARRRGSAWRQPRRRLEQQVRREGAAFRQWVTVHGLNRVEAAACLGIAARTLRAWEERLRAPAPAVPARGRPVLRSARPARAAVLELLEVVGPGAGLAVLTGQFPDLPKAELGDLLKRYRRAWVRRHPQPLHVLHWQQPGSVWAIDYARPPLPLEEGYTDLLAVRDLAGGMQLLWLPVAEATAATATAALLSLFLLYGAPLVLKLDHGSPFVAQAMQELLSRWQVVPLYSPPGRPQYNGAIAAGIGALKARTHHQAVRQGRPGDWTLADAEAARQEANTLGRPWGGHGPTPAERWAGRHLATVPEREAFAASVACLEEEAAGPSPAAPPAAAPAAAPTATPRTASAQQPTATDNEAVTALPPQRDPATSSPPPTVPTGTERAGATLSGPAPDPAARRRQAISRALVAHGYLVFTRRRIPPPIRRKKVT
jgi:transposase InsO family protein